MDSIIKIYLERSENEIVQAEILYKVTSDQKLQKEVFHLDKDETFYSGVISHCYYAVFYAAKAILLTKRVKTYAPSVHKKTYDEFKRVFVDTGLLDMKLFDIYQEMVVKASELLEIYKISKSKRGKFTYKTIPQANKSPAEESLKHAKTFVSNIGKVVRKNGH